MHRFLLALLSLLLLAACDSADLGPEASDLLTADVWIPRAPDAVPSGSATRYEFQEDGTLLLEFDGAPPEEESWTLEEDDTVLVIRDGRATLRLAVEQLTEDVLVLEEIPFVPDDTPFRFELVHP